MAARRSVLITAAVAVNFCAATVPGIAVALETGLAFVLAQEGAVGVC